MSNLRYLSNIVTLELDTDICVGCKRCVEVCPHGVFVIENNKARIIDLDACMECGACAMNCSAGAISVNAGVGCAAAVLSGKIKRTGHTCDCSGDSSSCC